METVGLSTSPALPLQPSNSCGWSIRAEVSGECYHLFRDLSSAASGLVGAALTTAMAAQRRSSPPDFSSKKVGWRPIGGDFIESAGERAQSRAQRSGPLLHSKWHGSSAFVADRRSHQSD